MNYLKHYNKLIETRKRLNRNKHQGVYYENHHIVPKCMGGGNSKDNLVLLTAKEHFLAHLLLAKGYKNKKLYYSVFMMGNTYKEKRNLTSKQVERAKQFQSLAMSGENNPMFGKKHSSDTKRKMSKKRLGKKISKEAKQKLSKANLGKVLSEETKTKISKSLSGKKNYRHNPIKYKFYNLRTKETVKTTCYDLRLNYGCISSSSLPKGKVIISGDWVLYKNKNKNTGFDWLNVETGEEVKTTLVNMKNNWDCPKPYRLVKGLQLLSKGWMII